MRILLITDEEWNDAVYGNNILTNWFTDYDAVFAQIYCSPGLPNNSICEWYFQITDGQMLRSIVSGTRAGKRFYLPTSAQSVIGSRENAQRKGIYLIMKKISLFANAPIQLLRDLIWHLGRYDIDSLKEFIDGFNPDLVFCPRVITPKLMRLEREIKRLTSAPFVAFTADNEASLQCYSWSLLFWLRRFAIYRAFKKHVKLYNHYFMFSEEQARDYHQKYGIPTSCLYKCGQFKESFIPKHINSPIRMVYAGRLYCNRWKTLMAIGDALEQINSDGEKMVLDIYSAESLTFRQDRALRRYRYLQVHTAITPTQLAEEYKKADIAIHVESFDKSYRMATRYSLSTKIIDLMASTCAIMAICWEKQSGYLYLKTHDAAFCASEYDEILSLLRNITQRPSLIHEYAEKAWECGRKNHTREVIQNQIKETFHRVMMLDARAN